jgi:hypothetical protein
MMNRLTNGCREKALENRKIVGLVGSNGNFVPEVAVRFEPSTFGC